MMENVVEVWKDIPGYEARYRVSSLGRVYSLRNDGILTLKKIGKGYWGISLFDGKNKKRFLIHRLVALAFLSDGYNDVEFSGLDVNHKNLDKTDNRVCNLELISHADNMKHAYLPDKLITEDRSVWIILRE